MFRLVEQCLYNRVEIAAPRGVCLTCWRPGTCLLFFKRSCPNYFDDLQANETKEARVRIRLTMIIIGVFFNFQPTFGQWTLTFETGTYQATTHTENGHTFDIATKVDNRGYERTGDFYWEMYNGEYGIGTLEITGGMSAFDIESIYLRYAWGGPGNVTIEGYNGATLENTTTLSIGNTYEKADLNWSSITKLRVVGTVQYSKIFIDDIAYQTENSLPVELSSFTATRKSNTMLLNWVTESEIENLGFLIERSENGGAWHEIASFKDTPGLAGQGSVTHHTEYSYTDANITNQVLYNYRLADVSYKGDVQYHALDSEVVDANNALLPSDLRIHKNYPNPFNPSTIIAWEIGSANGVELAIYDMNGRVVRELVNSYQSAGYHEARWDGRDSDGNAVPAGLYVYQVKSGQHTKTQKMLLLK